MNEPVLPHGEVRVLGRDRAEQIAVHRRVDAAHAATAQKTPRPKAMKNTAKGAIHP